MPIAEETAASAEAATEPESASEATALVHEEATSDSSIPPEGTLQEFLDRAAAVRIRKAIDFAKGNRNAAATALGIDRTTLYRLMRRLGL